MKPETKAFIDACEERASKATPGPWIPSNQFGRTAITTPHSPYDSRTAIAGHHGISDANAEFIAQARTDVPDLIRIIREQDAEIERLREYETKWNDFWSKLRNET